MFLVIRGEPSLILTGHNFGPINHLTCGQLHRGGTTSLQGVWLECSSVFSVLEFCSHVHVIRSLFLCHVSI